MKRGEVWTFLVMFCVLLVGGLVYEHWPRPMVSAAGQVGSHLRFENTLLEKTAIPQQLADWQQRQQEDEPPKPKVQIDYANPVFTQQESDYLSDAVFIGDSRTQGLQLGTGLTQAVFLAERGMSVDLVNEKAIFPLSDGSTGTVYQVLEEQTFSKAYLMFGLNELGWYDVDEFISQYRQVIQKIHELQPDILIYVQAMIPVTEEKSNDGDVYTNDKIFYRNQRIQQMAQEESCVFLDPGEAVRNEEGALPAEAATDGIHLTAEYCQKWLDYLLQHAIVLDTE